MCRERPANEYEINPLLTKLSLYLIDPLHTKLSLYLNFHSLEVVSRYRDPQLQVGENYLYLLNLDLDN